MSKKVYSPKKSEFLKNVTKISIEKNANVEIFAENNFARFLKVNKGKTYLTFKAAALGSESKKYLPENIGLLAQDTFNLLKLLQAVVQS